MFKALLTQHNQVPLIRPEHPEGDGSQVLCETEADAERQAQHSLRDDAACIVPLVQQEGGVDASSVLHCVDLCEVHACVEATLPSDADTVRQKSEAQQKS